MNSVPVTILYFVEVLFIAQTMLYVLVIGVLWFYWKKAKPRTDVEPLLDTSVALIVPVRNEAANLPRMIRQLRHLPIHWAVVWVDDHSSDGSFEMLKKSMEGAKPENWKVIKSDGEGKKQALSTGIGATSAEIIVTTDADVIISGNPFLHLVSHFQDNRIQLVAGPVLSADKSGVFAGIQQVEWGSIQLVTGATFSACVPVTCSGANLTFRRSAFERVGGYRNNLAYASGDDEFLLKQVVAIYGSDAVHFVRQPAALVEVEPFQSGEDLIAQRVRWASKWHIHGVKHASGAVLGFLFPASFAFAIVLVFWPSGAVYLAGGWLVKCVVDSWVLGAVLRIYGKRPSLLQLVATSVWHPFFIIRVTWGSLLGKFEWKGRKSA